MNAAFPAAALKEYRAARELDQESVELFFHLGMAYWGNQPIDSQYFSTALESFYDFLDRGEPLELVALHRHTFGSCVGIFTLTRDSVSYQSPGEEDLDHFFDVPLEAIVELRRRPEAGYSGTLVVIRAPSAEQVQKNEGKTKNWTLYFQPTSILVDCNSETASYSAYADACAAATTYSDSAALSATRWKPVYARGSCEPTTSGGLGSFSCWPMASPTRLYRRCCGATRPSWPGGRAGSSTIVWPGSSPVIRGGPSRNERRGSRPAFSTGRDVAHRMARPTGRRGSSRSTLGRIT